MNQRSYIPGLDGLRALAALAVFAVHWQQITHLSGHLGPIDLETFLENGNTGVAMFFLLSGLLLGLPYWQKEKALSLTRYATSRAARIAPAYYLCLTALVIVGTHWQTPRDLADTALHYTFTHNFAEFSIYSLNDPFWTIAVQVQFYLLFPLLLVLTKPFRRSTALGMLTLLALAIVSYFAHRAMMLHYQPADTDYVVSHSILAHLPLFLMGWAAGPLMPNVRNEETNRGGLHFDALFMLAVISLVAILGVPSLDDRFSITFGRYNLPYVPLLLLVMVLCAPRAPLTRTILECKPIRLLGVISYGLYLYHLPCMRLVSRIMQSMEMSVSRRFWLFAFAALALSIAASTISWVLIEKPILRLAKGKARPQPAKTPST